MIAALYVARDGVYWNRPDVDAWDEERDARTYPGPFPVVAHPPCVRWSSLAYLNQSRLGYKVGDDGGCFASALMAVRTFGGVLEHPAGSIAWSAFGLPEPRRGGWSRAFLDAGWTTEVSQSAYGHRARKRTWLYYIGPEPPPLDWSEPPAECKVGDLRHATDRRDRPRMYQREALATPPAFADQLIALAEGVPCRPH